MPRRSHESLLDPSDTAEVRLDPGVELEGPTVPVPTNLRLTNVRSEAMMRAHDTEVGVQRFVDNYLSYYNTSIWSPVAIGHDEDVRRWADRQKLVRVSGPSWLSELRRQYEDLAWDAVPGELFEHYTWVDLVVPLLSISGPRSEFYASAVADEVREGGTFPCASDREGEGWYFVDLRRPGDDSVYFRYHDDGRVIGPLAGSIVLLLDAVAVLLAGMPAVDEPWSEGVVTRAREADATLDAAWEGWWARHLR